jgi:DNA-binding PadR family transcriptional regulator
MIDKTKKTRAPFRITPVVFHVLLTLAETEAHAYGIMKEVSARTDGTVSVGPGSLHFTLNKLVAAHMIEESDARPDAELDDARRKYYALTEYGRVVLSEEAQVWADIVELARSKHLIPGRGVA